MADNNGFDGSIVINTELDNEGFEKDADKLISSVDGLTKRMDAFGAEMRQAFAGVTSVLQHLSSATGGTASGTANYAQQATQAAQAAQQAAQAQTATAKQAAQAQAQAATATTNAAKATSNYDKELTKLQKQIAAAKNKLSDYYQEIAQIEQSTNTWLEGADGPTADAQIDNILEIEQLQLDAINQKYAAKIEILKQLEAEYARVAAARDAATQSNSDGQAQQQANGLSGALKALSQAFRENVTDEKALDAAAKRVASVFGDMGRKAKNVAKQLLKLPFKAVAASAKAAVSGLKSFVKQAQKTGLSTKGLVKSLTSLKTLLVARIKRMFISAIFSDVQEGLKQLALFNSRFNSQMSGMKNSMTQLSGNISATIGNLLSALEPVISTIVDLMNKAVTAVNQFFALLNGKRTYTVAKKGADKYAEAADGAAAAQKKFNAELYSFDELNRQSKPSESSSGSVDDSSIQYEEVPVELPQSAQEWIMRLKEAWQSGDWHSVGQTVAEGLNFAMKAVDDWINNTLRPEGVKWAGHVAEILNGLTDGTDWPALGKTIADGLNAIADTVNTFLTTFQAKLFGGGIGTAIRAWFDTVDWSLIGQTFANGWNFLAHFIEGVVTTPGVWASIGRSIAEYIRSWFATIDINSVAESFIAVFNGVTTLISTFLAQNPFEGIAEKIYSAIDRVLREINWQELAQTVGRLFLEVLKTLFTIVQKIDWKQMGVVVGQALSSINWGEVFATIGKLIWTAIGAMFEFLGGMIKGDGLGVLIAGFTILVGNLAAKLAGALFKAPLQSALTSVIADLLKGLVGSSGIGGWGVSILAAGKTLLGSIVAKIGTICTTVLPAALASLGKILSGIVAAIGGWPAALIAAAAVAITALVIWIKNGGGEVIQGFFQGITDALVNVGTWIKENLIDPVVNAVKNLFGIHSPSTVFAEIGRNVIQGLLEGISASWQSITDFFSNAISNLTTFLSDGWTNIVTNAKGAWENLKTNVTTAFSNAKTGLAETATRIGSNLTAAWTNVRSTAQDAWSNIRTNVTTAFDNAKTGLTNTAAKIKSNLTSAWREVNSDAKSAWKDVHGYVTDAFKNAGEALTKTASQIRSNLSTAWSDVSSTARTAWSNIYSSVSNAFANTRTAVLNTASNMRSNLVTAFSGIITNAQSAWSNLHNVTISYFSTLRTNVLNAWTNLRTNLNNVQWKNVGHNLVAGLNNGVAGAWGNFMSNVSSLVNSLISRVKSLFGIRSPSKVFAQIGEFLDKGLENGVLGGERSLLATAKNVATAVTDSLTPDSPSVEVGVDGVVGNMQTVVSSLSAVAETFQTIASALNSIGGLTVPQIAAGTVVPYQTKVAAETAPAEDGDGVMAYLLGILSELQALARTMRSGDGSEQIIQVNVDGHEIFQVVVDENKKAVRSNGYSPLKV